MRTRDPGIQALLLQPVRSVGPRIGFACAPEDFSRIRNLKAIVGQATADQPRPVQKAVTDTLDIIVRPLVILEFIAIGATIFSSYLLYRTFAENHYKKAGG